MICNISFIPALHRYLRHRIADYDYERHFGGVIYLFLRGVDKEHPQQRDLRDPTQRRVD